MAERETGIPGDIIALKGPMFSGKTGELLRLRGREEIGGNPVQMFKPLIGERGEGLNLLKSRNGSEGDGLAVQIPIEILENLSRYTKVVMVDEAQFFSQKRRGVWEITNVLKELSNRGIKVYVAGLPRDFKREPFGPMPQILAMAQEVRELTAVCTESVNGQPCKKDATETQRFVGGKPASWNDPIVLVGDVEEGYAARCTEHHVIYNAPKSEYEGVRGVN